MMAGPATRVVATADVAPHADRSLWAGLASGRRTWWTAGLLSLLVLTAALYDSFGGSRTVVVPVRAHRLQHQGLRSLPLAARGPVSTVLGRENAAYQVGVAGGALHAGESCSAAEQQLRQRRGVRQLRRLYGYPRLARAGLRLLAEPRSAPGCPPGARHRVAYSRPGLSEWYANGPLGLEQGFMVAKAPARHAPGPLTLVIGLAADVRASLDPAGKG